MSLNCQCIGGVSDLPLLKVGKTCFSVYAFFICRVHIEICVCYSLLCLVSRDFHCTIIALSLSSDFNYLIKRFLFVFYKLFIFKLDP